MVWGLNLPVSCGTCRCTEVAFSPFSFVRDPLGWWGWTPLLLGCLGRGMLPQGVTLGPVLPPCVFFFWPRLGSEAGPHCSGGTTVDWMERQGVTLWLRDRWDVATGRDPVACEFETSLGFFLDTLCRVRSSVSFTSFFGYRMGHGAGPCGPWRVVFTPGLFLGNRLGSWA